MAEKIEDGGLAFPGKRVEQVGTVADHGFSDDDSPTFGDVDHPGMTLRDWFAGNADVPWNAVIETLSIRGNKNPTVSDLAAYRAEIKFIEADAMIARRKAGA
jgi:hypothetical protein